MSDNDDVRFPDDMRQTSEYDESEVEYFIVEGSDGAVYQCWRREVGKGGRPVGSTEHSAEDIRKVAELTASDEDLSRGEIAERVGASKSWVQDCQRDLLFL